MMTPLRLMKAVMGRWRCTINSSTKKLKARRETTAARV